MKKRYRILILFVVITLIFTSAPQCCADYQRPKIDIIREMANTYYANPRNSKERVDMLLADLRKIDEKTADDWTDIMDYWRFLEYDLELSYDETPDELVDTDQLCIIVLGFQLNLDGSMKDELVRRLEGALACANKYPNAYVLCSGGGTAGLKHDATEAGEMAKWLIENGVDESRVLIEDNSTTTNGNARLSYALLRENCPQVSSAVIISSDYHIRWAMLIFYTQFLLAGREITLANHIAVHPPFQPGYSVRNYMVDGVTALANDYT